MAKEYSICLDIGGTKILGAIFDAGEKSSWAGWMFPVIIILATLRLYRDHRKEREAAEKERKRIQEQGPVRLQERGRQR